MDWFEFLHNLKQPLDQAARLALSMQAEIQGKNKNPDAPEQMSTAVTTVDLLVQDIIFLHLLHTKMQFDFYSEELASLPPEMAEQLDPRQKNSNLIFFLDPIDGTEEYIAQGTKFSVMGGILDKCTGKVLCSFVFFPKSYVYMIAIRGRGVFMSEGIGLPQFRKIQRSDLLSANETPRVAPDYKRMAPQDFAFLTEKGLELGEEPKHAGGALMDLVFHGMYSLIIMRKFHGHDTAPASLFVEELGGGAFDENGWPIIFPADMRRMPVVTFSLNRELALSAATFRE
jgi:3'-phosphoadenosine 5'-phosphosulfate (PAPS) 3'-phosphatase